MTAFTTADRDGVRVLSLDLPDEPVNKITKAVREELGTVLDDIQRAGSVRAVVLRSAKADNFIAGADIDEFVALETQAEAHTLVTTGQALINRLERLGLPVVAAIHGACVGGGFEAALACSYRVATDHPKTVLGLPEVQLGILPAAGGCQRLPRLIGTVAALDIILAGKTVPSKKAFRLGMVDELVHPAVLDDVAFAAATKLAGGWRPKRAKGGLRAVALDRNPVGRKVVFSQAEKTLTKKTGGNYPAPFAALDAVQHGLANGVTAGLTREAEHFAELALSDVSRNLVHIFFATNELKKDTGVSDPAPEPADVTNLGLVGAGFMGAGIGGTAVLKAQVDVRFQDADLDRVGAGLRAATKILDGRLKRKRLSKFDHRRMEALLSGTTDWSGFGRADLVIEAVFEDLEVKHSVFRELEARVPDHCVLASNTSTIPIHNIAEATERPERVLGMHFFSPVEKMPLLEVIVTDQTASGAIVTAVAFGRRMGKTVIVVADQPGFWVNRILSPYMNEAARLVQEGISIEQIDRAMKRFGFPVGPITLLDEVGLDVAKKASGVMHEAFGDRMAPGDGLARLIGDRRFGRKNGRGFYQYDDKGKRGEVDDTVYELMQIEPRPVPDADVTNRLVYAMLNESALAVADGVVRSARDGDIGAIFGIGYPPFRGGPLRYLDTVGVPRVVEMLDRLQHAYGDRFAPAPLLHEMRESRLRFYPES